ISDNAVYTFCKDREGGIWCGTYFGGVNYFPKQALSFQKYFPENGKNGLTGNVVREIHQDKNDNLWIGTEDAGLNRMNMRTGKFESYTPTGTGDGISYTNIHGLLATDNELWIGTFEHGLDVMNIKTGKVERHYSKNTDSNSLKSNFIYCIYQSPDKDIMLGTTIGAYRYNRSSDNFSPITGLPLYTWYSSLLKDEDGIIWGATYGNGLNFADTRTGTNGNFRYDQHNRNSLASDRINSLFQDSEHNLWLATEGGLCKFDRNKKSFARYTTENGFPTNCFCQRRHKCQAQRGQAVGKQKIK
ncbi:MAG: hybrid sensor histidine kinase/response regulator, partial [Sphingobacteriales bacterium]